MPISFCSCLFTIPGIGVTSARDACIHSLSRLRVRLSRPLRIECPLAYDHIMNRGLAYQPVCSDHADRRMFLDLIEECHEMWGDAGDGLLSHRQSSPSAEIRGPSSGSSTTPQSHLASPTAS